MTYCPFTVSSEWGLGQVVWLTESTQRVKNIQRFCHTIRYCIDHLAAPSNIYATP